MIDAIETALDLPQGELNLEREVLRDYGNMSAPTVLFVLERLIERGLPKRMLMTAFGPGFTCAGLAARSAHDLARLSDPGAGHAAAAWRAVAVRTATPGGCSRSGAHEVGRGHYPFDRRRPRRLAGRLWWLAPGRPIHACRWSLFVLQLAARLGDATLGRSAGRRGSSSCPARRWSAAGPTAWSTIPIIWIVVGEIAVLPLVFGLPDVALFFSLLNAAVLWIRIREENGALTRILTACAAGSRPISPPLLDIAEMLRLVPGPGAGSSAVLIVKDMHADLAAVTRLIEPEVKALGFDLVRVAMIGGTSDPTLQIMAERPDTRQLTIDDCADLSRGLSDVLETGRPDRGRLPAGSQLARHRPAADPAHRYRRLGRARGPAQLATADRRRQAGVRHHRGLDGDTIRIATPKGEREVPFNPLPRPSCS